MKSKWFASLSCFSLITVAILANLPLLKKPLIAQPQLSDDLLDAYVAALQDAAKTEEKELLDNLTLIVDPELDSNLYWDHKGRVLVVTFTSQDCLKEGQIQTCFERGKPIDKRTIWVTAVPQLKNFCTDYLKQDRGVNFPKLNQRLEQVLGIIPYSRKTHIAEIWVDPQYLKRPMYTPNVEKYDQDTAWQFIEGENFGEGADQAYQNWFNSEHSPRTSQKAEQERINQIRNQADQQKYRDQIRTKLTNNNYGDDPYPWTGLGYTYDWDIDPQTGQPIEKGLTEFVILLPPHDQLSSPIEEIAEVNRVFSIQQYCQ